MSLNSVTSSERIHIAFFGMRNAGKSSLVNAITSQKVSVVSEIKGTTTDPVRKSMELLPLGPVVIIDTPGFDDEGVLGNKRVERTKQILGETDIAILVVDAVCGLSKSDKDLLQFFLERKIPHIIVYNKMDLLSEKMELKENEICVSAQEGVNLDELMKGIGEIKGKMVSDRVIISDLLTPGDLVVLVVPIDESAPKGRLILPQQQTIRDILDAHCSVITCQETELKDTLSMLKESPRIVVTDSQVFGKVASVVPREMFLTSFSILMARYKGELDALVKGADELANLKDGDCVLIAESCTHHRQCNDIGRVKLPNWISEYSKAKLDYSFCSGMEFPDELEKYKLVVHCGGCMLNETAMHSRLETAKRAGVPIVNYGVAIAKMHGILDRSLEVFKKTGSSH